MQHGPQLPASPPLAHTQVPRRPRLRATAALLFSLSVTLGAAQGQGIAENGPTPVIAAQVRQAPAASAVPLTGTLLARRVSQLSAQLAGYVESLAVDVGDEVTAGEEIAQLDATIARTNVSAARADVTQARAALADAVRRRDEARELVAQSNVAESFYESLVAEAEQARAALARREAQLAQGEALLARHRITAPFDGVVARRSTEAGEWLQPGAPVVELQELDVVRLRVDVPQSLYGRIDVGTRAQVEFDAYANAPWRAAVSIRVPIADPNSRAFPVLLELDNRDRRLTPGMSARVALQVSGEQGGETLAVPRDAIVRGPDGITRVWVVRPGDGASTVAPVAVRVGRSFDALVEILDRDAPIEAGEQVVIRGNEMLRAGQAVRLVSTPAGSN